MKYKEEKKHNERTPGLCIASMYTADTNAHIQKFTSATSKVKQDRSYAMEE